MKSGIYLIAFTSNGEKTGEGLVVVDGDKVNGGDASYLYRGRYSGEANDLRAELQISHYRGQGSSLFPGLEKYTLNVAGRGSETTFTLEGGVAGRPGMRIIIAGHKIADLG